MSIELTSVWLQTKLALPWNMYPHKKTLSISRRVVIIYVIYLNIKHINQPKYHHRQP